MKVWFDCILSKIFLLFFCFNFLKLMQKKEPNWALYYEFIKV